MRQIPSPSDLAIVSGDFEQFSPGDLYDYFTSPGLLTRWWPQSAEVEPSLGGKFLLSWPENDWRLRGTYTAREPGVHLGFTWSWDHEPSQVAVKQVDVWFMPLFEHGARLAIFHGPFDATQSDQEARQGIVEGWIHFGMILAGIRRGDVEC
jgi:uncharacterized protein YndB with AHSA1/START domain